jgi:hypothetical protein
MEISSVDDEQTKKLFKEVVEHIQCASTMIKGGELYFEKIKEIGIIDETRFKKIVDIMMGLKVNSKCNEWEKKEPLEDLAVLAAIYHPNFFHENVFLLQKLDDLKFILENIYNITVFLFADNADIPQPYLKYSSELKETFSTEIEKIENMSGLSSKHDFILLKEMLYPMLVEHISCCNVLCIYNKVKEPTESGESTVPFTN